MQFIPVLAILSTTLFAGAATYINFAEHPARMACGVELAVTVFGPSYKRASVMQAALALIATAAGAATWFAGAGVMWLAGTLCIFAVIPFTLIVIRPVNKKLNDPRLDRRAQETRLLLKTWGKLHAVRTVLSLTASLIFLTNPAT